MSAELTDDFYHVLFAISEGRLELLSGSHEDKSTRDNAPTLNEELKQRENGEAA